MEGTQMDCCKDEQERKEPGKSDISNKAWLRTAVFGNAY